MKQPWQIAVNKDTYTNTTESQNSFQIFLEPRGSWSIPRWKKVIIGTSKNPQKLIKVQEICQILKKEQFQFYHII